MSIPTHEDAHLLVRLFSLRLEPYMQQSEDWFVTQFQSGSWADLKERYPNGSREWRMLTTVLGYWEMIGALIDHNLLSEDLVFDAMESIDTTWDRVKEWLPQARLELGSDLWENIELLANKQRRWRIVRVPKSEEI